MSAAAVRATQPAVAFAASPSLPPAYTELVLTIMQSAVRRGYDCLIADHERPEATLSAIDRDTTAGGLCLFLDRADDLSLTRMLQEAWRQHRRVIVYACGMPWQTLPACGTGTWKPRRQCVPNDYLGPVQAVQWTYGDEPPSRLQEEMADAERWRLTDALLLDEHGIAVTWREPTATRPTPAQCKARGQFFRTFFAGQVALAQQATVAQAGR